MRNLLVLISAFLAVQAKTSWKDLDNYTFEQYLQEFHHQFPASELPTRRAMFDSELKRIKAHNAGSASWKEGVSKYTVLSAAEKKALYGRSKGAAQHQQKFLKKSNPFPEGYSMKPVSALPKSVDWRNEGIVSAVKDQGHCGSCWAFASTAVIESHVAKSTGLLFDLSPQQIAMCAPVSPLINCNFSNFKLTLLFSFQ